MDRERYQRIKGIFYEASELDGAGREAYLDNACANDTSLREEVEALFARESEDSRSVLDQPGAVGALAEEALLATAAFDAAEAIPKHVDRYRIVRKIGEGGMGIVFEAEQEEPIRRRVALKLIKLGMDTRQVIARFEAERQALAMMAHPNIASVLDAGASETGRPFFVMELVSGASITRYADEQRLSVRDRLHLFIEACHGVQHAHQKGIIHRDLKPSNMLVSVLDGRPCVKIIDFGVAKATEQRLTERTLQTQIGQFIGTPAYMSPEQAETGEADIDTRSDIYSLGIILYELLTGGTPFDTTRLRSAAYSEWQRVIREEDPPRPSSRVSRKTSEAGEVASLRRTEPGQLPKALRGDLDWIVMTAIEKDRTRRYESASELARDVERYLSDEPVSAQPPTRRYRLRKFYRRHRTTAIVGVVVLAALIGGATLSTIGLVQARRERQIVDDRSEQLRRELYASRVERIARIIATDGRDSVKPLLSLCDEDLRGWEWRRLARLADLGEWTAKLLDGAIGTVQYSRDGRHLLVSGGDGTTLLVDPKTMARLSVLQNPPPGVGIRGACFSGDGRRVATTDANQFVYLWDVETGQRLRTIAVGPDGHLQAVALDEDGSHVAVGCYFGPTKVFDSRTGALILSIETPGDRASDLWFLEGGAALFVGSFGGDLSVWNIAEGNMRWRARGDRSAVFASVVSDDGALAASVGAEGELWLLETKDASLRFSVGIEHTGNVAVAFQPGGQMVAVAGRDGIITLFDTRRGDKVRSLRGHERAIGGLAFDPDGRGLVSGDGAGVVKRWNLEHAHEPLRHYHPNYLNALAFSPDDATIYFGGYSGGLQAWDRATGEIRSSGGPFKDALRVAVSHDGRRIAVATDSAVPEIALLDANLTVLHRWSLGEHGVPSVAFSADDSRIVGTRLDSPVVVWNTESGEEVTRIDAMTGKSIRAIFTPDARQVIVATTGPAIEVRDLATGVMAMRVDVPSGEITNLSLDTSGHNVLLGGHDGVIRLIDWRSGEALRCLMGHAGQVTAVDESPDGSRLVSGGEDGSIRLWDSATGREIMVVGRHTDYITDVAFSHDGATIATCGYDHYVRIWETGLLRSGAVLSPNDDRAPARPGLSRNAPD